MPINSQVFLTCENHGDSEMEMLSLPFVLKEKTNRKAKFRELKQFVGDHTASSRCEIKISNTPGFSQSYQVLPTDLKLYLLIILNGLVA